MTCTAPPVVSVSYVCLKEEPNVKVSVVIEGVFSDLLKDEELSKYIRAVCVLSIYDPVASANAYTVNPESVFELNGHWANTEWYKLWDGYLRAEVMKTPSDSDYIVFKFDLESLIDPDNSSDDVNALWSEAKYLCCFVYIQVDTVGLATQYGIEIADEYKGVASDYSKVVIISEGKTR